jgi:RNA polymerase subunit RPABC4/transcription elongation factor Spt4
MTLPPNLDTYVAVVFFVLGAYIFALYVGLIVWTVRDVRARSRDVLGQIMATLLVAIFTLPGLLIYLLLRPHTTLAEEYERSLAEESLLQELEEQRVCPGCRRRVEPDFVVCPHCHQQLRLRCVGCGRLLNLDWDVCPYCGRFREQAEPEEAEAAEPIGVDEPVAEAPAMEVQAVALARDESLEDVAEGSESLGEEAPEPPAYAMDWSEDVPEQDEDFEETAARLDEILAATPPPDVDEEDETEFVDLQEADEYEPYADDNLASPAADDEDGEDESSEDEEPS